MNRVLVTGASGFIGTQVLPLLGATGAFEIHAVTSRPKAAGGNAHWHHADLLSPGSAERLVDGIRPSHLLHLAWYAEPGKYWSDPANIGWVEASLRLVRAFREHGGARAVLAGSCAEYDWKAGICREQDTPLRPASVYGGCKHAMQLLLEAYATVTGLSSAWGRVFYLYGPGEPVQRLVPSVIRPLLSGSPAACTAGDQARDYLHVEDVARAFVALLQSDHRGPVNIASGSATPVKALATEIARQLGRPELLRLGALPNAGNEPASIVGDNGLLSRLGWSPRYDLPDGIAQTIEWWKNHPGKV